MCFYIYQRVCYDFCKKKLRKSLILQNICIFAPANLIIGLWCNGNTTDSGPVIPGSSPGSPTKKPRRFSKSLRFFCFLLLFLSQRKNEHLRCQHPQEHGKRVDSSIAHCRGIGRCKVVRIRESRWVSGGSGKYADQREVVQLKVVSSH